MGRGLLPTSTKRYSLAILISVVLNREHNSYPSHDPSDRFGLQKAIQAGMCVVECGRRRRRDRISVLR
jgi:hypothetical protein